MGGNDRSNVELSKEYNVCSMMEASSFCPSIWDQTMTSMNDPTTSTMGWIPNTIHPFSCFSEIDPITPIREIVENDECDEAEFSGRLVNTADENLNKRKRIQKNAENNEPDVADTSKENGDQQQADPDPPKDDYIHVRARRGQATNSHSLAERIRREKISERMKLLQDLVPGCSKTNVALDVIKDEVSAAIFAPGWVYENKEPPNFQFAQNRLFRTRGLLVQSRKVHLIVSLQNCCFGFWMKGFH